ncbi:MAG: hypothetical protein L3J82_02140 [Planctomycetes bacterium]|nr:hypothetical protein [Planctomycetota bacterium]
MNKYFIVVVICVFALIFTGFLFFPELVDNNSSNSSGKPCRAEEFGDVGRENKNIDSSSNFDSNKTHKDKDKAPRLGNSVERSKVKDAELVDSEVSHAEEFISEFNRLSASNEWNKLEKYLIDSIRNAPDLPSFLPVLLGALSSVEDRIGYYPVGRGVQLGMYGRADLTEHAELLAEAFMSTDSPVLHICLAAATTRANSTKQNKTHLRRHVEILLLNRRQNTAGLSAMERTVYIDDLLSSHMWLSLSVLESIEFMESLQVTGLSNKRVRWYWDDCRRLLRAKRYFDGEVEAITRYLIAHTDESIRAKKGSKKEVARLAKIWVTFREQQAYDMAEKHADDATDETIQGAYDQILAKWLAFEE